MNVIMLSPGYPVEMQMFTRGLAAVGARVIGVGDTPEGALARDVRDCLSAYVQIPGFHDEEGSVRAVQRELNGLHVDRVESMWEPVMILAAKLREALGVPGMSVEETVPFRDKEAMKRVLDAAGIRTPKHYSASTVSGVREAAEAIGFPIIVKPIAGAGSADTHRVNNVEELEHILARIEHVREVSVEEFVDGDEFTFDTVCKNGEVLFYNICSYHPRPLLSRQLEWVSPVTMARRNPDAPELANGKKMGFAVLEAMKFQDGFTHMEWYRKHDGEVVFGEIGARPPGARTVDIMNYASDIDLYTGWAEAMCHGRISQPIVRKYNCASIFKRAQGQGNISRVDGLTHLMSEYGEWIATVELLPIGAPRRNWLQTLISDGMVIIRHPNLDSAMEIAGHVCTDLQMYAG